MIFKNIAIQAVLIDNASVGVYLLFVCACAMVTASVCHLCAPDILLQRVDENSRVDVLSCNDRREIYTTDQKIIGECVKHLF